MGIIRDIQVSVFPVINTRPFLFMFSALEAQMHVHQVMLLLERVHSLPAFRLIRFTAS